MRLLVAISISLVSTGLLAQPSLIQTLRDGNPGIEALDGAASAVLSADERFLYVAGRFEAVISQYEIDPVSGLLTPVEEYRNGNGDLFGMEGVLEMVISPNGNFLFCATYDDNSVVIFSRDNESGTLTFVDTWFDGLNEADFLEGTRDLAVSPDGNHLYVLGSTDNAITVFQINNTTGELTWVEHITRDTEDENLTDLLFPGNLVFAPNGTDLYVTMRSTDSLFHFNRNAGDGTLTVNAVFRNVDEAISGLDGADDVLLSADGSDLYVAGDNNAAIAHFSRDTGNGTLTFQAAFEDDNETIDGLEGVTSLALSPDGATMYATGRLDSALTTFSVGADGALTQTAVILDDTDLNTSLGGANFVLSALDGRVLYVMARIDDAVNVFTTEPVTSVDVRPPYFITPDALHLEANGDINIDLPDPDSDGAVDLDNLGYLVSVLQRGRILDGPILVTPPSITSWPSRVTLPAASLPAGSYSIGLRRGTSLVEASDELILPAPTTTNTLPDTTTGAFTRWLLHIPRLSGGFGTAIQMSNRHQESSVEISLVAFDADGSFLATETRTLAPAMVTTYTLYGNAEDDLFPTLVDQVSHIAVWDPRGTTRTALAFTGLTTGFQAVYPEVDLGRGEIAGAAFTVRGRPDATTDEGLAVLNLTGSEPAEVALRQIDAITGDTIATVTLGTVPAGGKRLFLASDLTGFIDGADYIVETTDPNARIQLVWLALADGGFMATTPVTKIR